MKEVWKNIVGYKGIYKISNLGRVVTIKTNLIKKPTISKQGYFVVDLYKKNKREKCLLHRLIATAFIPNPLCKPQINHINGIRTDNTIENLEWTTQSENIKWAYAIGNRKTKLSQIDVNKIKSLRGTMSSLKVAEIFGVHSSNIRYIWANKIWRVA